MAVLTRSRAAAQSGLHPTPLNTNKGDARSIHETAVPGTTGNRKPARGRRAKTSDTQTSLRYIEAGNPASTTSRTGSKANSQSEGSNDRHEPQPRTATQTISQTRGLYVKVTFEQVETTSNAASSSSQQLPASPPEANGAGTKKPRKCRQTTEKHGPKPSANTRRTGQNKMRTVHAGTERRREDGESYPKVIDEAKVGSALATRTRRRVRQEKEGAPAADVPNHDAVDEAVKRIRRNKGKAKAVDVLTTEDASVGSKRRRDEEDVDAGDVSHPPLDPGPSRRTTRRTRQKAEVRIAEETKKRTTRKPSGRRTAVPAPPKKTARKVRIPRASRNFAPENESQQPIIVPPPPLSTERREAEEPKPQEAAPDKAVNEEGVTPSLYPYKTPSRSCTCRRCKREPPEWLRRILLPEPLVPVVTTPGPFVLRPANWSS